MIIRLAAPAAAVLALAACQQQEAKVPAVPAVPVAEVVSTATGADQAVGCMAYLALKQGALEAQTPPGDVTAVRAAMNDWEGVALKTMTQDEVSQYFASSVAVEDDASPEKMEVTAAWCLANKPAAS
ncbi:hypothetical protein [Brevundimonas sp. NIBR11]|uniref:hypothetical protein n=1 Tax=Brevundimonas sp. NIBR11 TaxID=3015999 RepID=UPI0022F078ED|nr:hypothetical protein [Brevundimonas sp. NIBR11]WGM30778.1 hypothetical protein KKHFBJBL_01009 [Brevundimonas sp. NIBR11]